VSHVGKEETQEFWWKYDALFEVHSPQVHMIVQNMGLKHRIRRIWILVLIYMTRIFPILKIEAEEQR
jgi:hypothetical protein